MISNMSEAGRLEEEEGRDEKTKGVREPELENIDETGAHSRVERETESRDEDDDFQEHEGEDSLELGMNESDRMEGDEVDRDLLDDLLPTKEENNFGEEEEDIEQRDDVSDDEEENSEAENAHEERDNVEGNAVSDIRESSVFMFEN